MVEHRTYVGASSTVILRYIANDAATTTHVMRYS